MRYSNTMYIPGIFFVLGILLVVPVTPFCTTEGSNRQLSGNFCYFTDNTDKHWTQCNGYCIANLGWVVDIENLAEQNTVSQFKNNQMGGAEAWLGAQCSTATGCNSPTMTNKWSWVSNGNPATYKFTNTINGGAGEYLRMQGSNYVSLGVLGAVNNEWQDAENTRPSVRCICKKRNPNAVTSSVVLPASISASDLTNYNLCLTIPFSTWNGVKIEIAAGTCTSTTIGTFPMHYVGQPSYDLSKCTTVSSTVKQDCNLAVSFTNFGSKDFYNIGSSITFNNKGTISVSAIPDAQYNTNTTDVTITLSASPDTSLTISVATAASGLTFYPGTLTFNNGETTKTFNVHSTSLGVKTLTYGLTAGETAKYVAPGSSTVTFVKAVASISLSAGPVLAGVPSPAMSVTLSAPPENGLSISFSGAGLTYNPSSLTFLPGEDTKTFTYESADIGDKTLLWLIGGVDMTKYEKNAISVNVNFTGEVTLTMPVKPVMNTNATITFTISPAPPSGLSLNYFSFNSLFDVYPVAPLAIGPGESSATITMTGSSFGPDQLKWTILASGDHVYYNMAGSNGVNIMPSGGPIAMASLPSSMTVGKAYASTLSVTYSPLVEWTFALAPSVGGAVRLNPENVTLTNPGTSASFQVVTSVAGTHLLEFIVFGPSAALYSVPTPFNITVIPKMKLSLNFPSSVYPNATASVVPISVTPDEVNEYKLTMTLTPPANSGLILSKTFFSIASPNTTIPSPLLTVQGTIVGQHSIGVAVSGGNADLFDFPSTVSVTVLRRNKIVVGNVPQLKLKRMSNRGWPFWIDGNTFASVSVMLVSSAGALQSVPTPISFSNGAFNQSTFLLPAFQGSALMSFVVSGADAATFEPISPVRVTVGPGNPSLVSASNTLAVLVPGERLTLVGNDFMNFTGPTTAYVGTRACAKTIVDSNTRLTCVVALNSAKPNTTVSIWVRANEQDSNTLLTNLVYLEAPLLGTQLVSVVDEDMTIGTPALSVSTLVPATAPVEVTITVNDPTEGAVETKETTLTLAGVDEKTVRLRGLPDQLRDGDVEFTVTVSSQSQDPFYAKSVQNFTFINRDSVSVVESISPEVIPQITGGVVTLIGRNFDLIPQAILVSNQTDLAVLQRDGQAPRPSTANKNASAGLNILQATPSSPSSPVQLVVKIDANLSLGAHDVNLVDANGRIGQALLSGIYVTDQCPDVGFVGGRDDCRPCPTGAECPGGNRIYPKKGYWSPGLNSGTVEACSPVSMCPGCENSQDVCYELKGAESGLASSSSTTGAASSTAPSFCPTGHEGPRCSRCILGYTMEFNRCVLCPSQDSQLPFIIADVVVWLLLALGIALIEDPEKVSHLLQAFICFQEIAQIGQDVSSNLPEWLLGIYKALHLFSGDVSFLKPDCQGRIDFFLNFAISIAYSVALFFLLLIVALCTMLFARIRHRGDVTGWKEARMTHYKNRLVRLLTSWLFLMYIALTRIGLSAVVCVGSTDGVGQSRLVLAEDLEVQCFTGKHIPVFITGVVLLLGVTLGLPLGYTVVVWRKGGSVYTDTTVMERWDFLVEPFHQRYKHMYHLEFLVLAGLAIGPAVLRSSPVLMMVATGIAFCVFILIILALRPYRKGWENILVILLCVANIFAVVTVYQSQQAEASGNADDQTVTIMMYMTVATAAVVILAYTGIVFYTLAVEWVPYRQLWIELQDEATAKAAVEKQEFRAYLDLIGHASASEDDDEIFPAVEMDNEPSLFAFMGFGASSGDASAQPDPFAILDELDKIRQETEEADAMTGAIGVADSVLGATAGEAESGYRPLPTPKLLPLHVRPVLPKVPDQGLGESLLASARRASRMLGFDSGTSPRPIPAYWQHTDSDTTQVVDVTDTHAAAMQSLFDATCRPELIGQGRDNRDLTHTGMEVVSVKRVENTTLWGLYALNAHNITKRYSERVLSRLPTETEDTPWNDVLEHAQVNEHLLFHGSSPEGVVAITETGYDERVSSTGMFGTGLYFGENSSKADEYARPDEDGVCYMFLSRVLLGLPYTALEGHSYLRRPPCLAGHTGGCSHLRYNSVVGETQHRYPHAVLAKYREFIVYDRNACYPEYVVAYRRVGSQDVLGPPGGDTGASGMPGLAADAADGTGPDPSTLDEVAVDIIESES